MGCLWMSIWIVCEMYERVWASVMFCIPVWAFSR